MPAAGLPESVPAITGGSGQQASHFTAQGVISGAYDVVASGVESMKPTPVGPGPYGSRVFARFHEGLVPRGLNAEPALAHFAPAPDSV